jgi:hypothetical protein
MQAVKTTIFPIAYDYVNLLNTMAQMQSSSSVSTPDNTEGRRELVIKKPGSNQIVSFCSMLNNGLMQVRDFSMATKTNFGTCCEFEELDTIDTNYLITSVKHANKNDVWLVAKHIQTNEFKSFLYTNTALSTSPILSKIGKTFSSNTFLNTVLKSNSTTNRIVFKPGNATTITVVDFNSSTGKISNPRFIENYNGKSFAISNDGAKLYVSRITENQEKIYELDFKYGAVSAMQSNEKLLKTISNDTVRNLSITEDDRLLVTTQNPLNFALIYPSNLNKNGEYSRTQITKDCGCNEKVTLDWGKKVIPKPYEWGGGTGPAIDIYHAQWEDEENILFGRNTFSFRDYPFLNEKFNNSSLVPTGFRYDEVVYAFHQASDGFAFQLSDESNGFNVSLSVNSPENFDPKTIKYIRNVFPTGSDTIGFTNDVLVEVETKEGILHTFSGTTYPAFVEAQPAFCRLQEEGTFHLLDEQGNFLDLETCEIVTQQETNYLVHEFNHLLITEQGERLSLNTINTINNY